MSHPYADLPPQAFWRSAVAQGDRLTFPGLYRPAFPVGPGTRIATAGSCFAQHIARYLTAAGVPVQDAEPAPRLMPPTLARRFGYGLFSGRYGNIYTARQMVQLLDDMIEGRTDPDLVWTLPGAESTPRYVDALRPTVEPDGIDSPEEVLLLRAWHLERCARMLMETDVFIFTLGLTEAWEDAVTGRVFPTCPGTVAGRFDPARHRFVNFRTAEVLADLHGIVARLRRFRPTMKLLLTVSPVPLTATASGAHVLTATARSKAVLRAAAAEIVEALPGEVDYFPSFEIVTHPASTIGDASGPFFGPDLRSVTEAGVDKVMTVFFAAHGLLPAEGEAEPEATAEPEDEEVAPEADPDDLVCEDLLLQAFAPGGRGS